MGIPDHVMESIAGHLSRRMLEGAVSSEPVSPQIPASARRLNPRLAPFQCDQES